MTLWTYRAFPNRAIDGDTIEVIVDHGMQIRSVQRIRLLGVNAPELFSGDHRREGTAARDAVQEWLDISLDAGSWPLLITTIQDKRTFNRYLATVTRTLDGTDLGDWLIDQGFATRAYR